MHFKKLLFYYMITSQKLIKQCYTLCYTHALHLSYKYTLLVYTYKIMFTNKYFEIIPAMILAY